MLSFPFGINISNPILEKKERVAARIRVCKPRITPAQEVWEDLKQPSVLVKTCLRKRRANLNKLLLVATRGNSKITDTGTVTAKLGACAPERGWIWGTPTAC